MIKQNSHILLAVVVFFDLLLLIMSYLFAYYLTFFELNFTSWNLNKIIVTICIILILFIALEKFEFSRDYNYRPLIEILKKITSFELFLLSIFYLTIIFKIYQYHNKFVFYYAVITLIVFFTERTFIKIILNLIRQRGYIVKRYLIIGAGETGLDFYRMSLSSRDLGIQVIGFLDDNEDLINSTDPVYTEKIKSLYLGPNSKLELILKTKMIDYIIIALPLYAVDKIIDIFSICERYGVKAELIPRYLKIITENPSVRRLKKFTLIGIRNVPLENMFNRFIKRIFDIGFSSIILIITFPLFFIITILIKLESRGPIFFFQRRTGYNQKEFSIIKFRTMKLNNDANTKQATKDDPRKTFIGDLLRKSNLDELPQLFNILIGDMSLIGPRPHMLAHTEEFYKKYDKYLVRHWVKPGLTGWAQVNGWRGDSDIGIRVKYDLEYIENWSLLFDAKILLLTVFGRKVKRHAY